MTSAADFHPRSSHTGIAARWVPILIVSVLLHLVFIAAVGDMLVLPTPAASHVYRSPDVVAATLIAAPAAPPAAATTATPAPKPRRATRAPQATAAPTPSSPLPSDLAEQPMLDEDAPPADQSDTAGQTTDTTAAIQPTAEAPVYRIKLLPSARLKYDIEKTPVNGATMHGSGTIDWQTDQSRYAIDGEFGVLFITALRFKSTGTIEATGIAPELYAEKRLRRSETNTHFHRERSTISFSASTNTYPRLGDEQDRASIIWQLAAIGRGDSEHFYPGATIQMVVAGTREAVPWQITVVGIEQIEVDGRQIESWRLARAARSGSYDQTLEFWLAPELGWYPVRLRYTEPNGDVLDMVLSRLNVSTTPESDQ